MTWGRGRANAACGNVCLSLVRTRIVVGFNSGAFKELL